MPLPLAPGRGTFRPGNPLGRSTVVESTSQMVEPPSPFHLVLLAELAIVVGSSTSGGPEMDFGTTLNAALNFLMWPAIIAALILLVALGPEKIRKRMSRRRNGTPRRDQ